MCDGDNLKDKKYNQTESFSRLSRDWYLATVLYDAIEDGNIRQATILLTEKYANPNIIIPEYGISPLHLAVGHESEIFAKEVTKLILRNGGNVNMKADDGITPLHIASAWNRAAVVRLLLSYGADPWILDDNERNAFHHAYQQNAWDAMNALEAFRKIECCGYPKKYSNVDCEYNLDKVILFGKDVQAEYKTLFTSPKSVCSMHSVSTQTEHSFTLEKEKSRCIHSQISDDCALQYVLESPLRVDKQFDLFQNMEGDILDSVNKSKIINHRKGSLYEFCPPRNFGEFGSWNDCKINKVCYEKLQTQLSENIDGVENNFLPSINCDGVTMERTNSCSGTFKDKVNRDIVVKEINLTLMSEDGARCTDKIDEHLLSEDGSQNFQHDKENNQLLTLMSEESPNQNEPCNFSELKHSANSISLDNKVCNTKNESILISEDGKISAANGVEKLTLISDEEDNPQNISTLISEDKSPKDNCTANKNDQIPKNDSGDLCGNVEKINLMEDRNKATNSNDRICDNEFSQIIKSTFDMVSSSVLANKFDKGSQTSNKCSPDLFTDDELNLVETNELKDNSRKAVETGGESSSPYFSAHDALNSCDDTTDINDQHQNHVTDDKEQEEVQSGDEQQRFLVSEQYKYTDDEEGVVLIEKRLPGKSASRGRGENVSRKTRIKPTRSNKNSRNEEIFAVISSDENNGLNEVLKHYGFNSKNLTDGSQKLYLRRLKRMKNDFKSVNYPVRPSQFGSELRLILDNCDNWQKLLSEWSCLDAEMVDYFLKHSTTARLRNDGAINTSFTYLLLDPNVTCNLPLRCDQIGLKETWYTFLEAIFYIGKGKNNRPYSHLYEAFAMWNRTRFSMTTGCNMKVKHILEIWKGGLGVVCLHIFQNISSAEASTREAAMIDAVGLPRLKNERSGVYYGNVVNWSRRQKQRLGVYLLYRAMLVLLADGERQLKPTDIE